MAKPAQSKKKNKKTNFFVKHKFRLVFFLLIVVLLFLFPSSNIYFKQVSKTKGLKVFEEIDLPQAPDYPVSETNIKGPVLTASGVIVKDIPSGAVLYKKYEKVRFPPASTTKIMTALVALEEYELDDVMKVGKVILENRKMDLVKGEQISVEALLYGILVHSANDAAYTLAENYPEGVEKFIEKMNEKAKELNLKDTHFTNSIGFDNEDQYTTASDLARLAQFALKDKTFAKIVSTKSITVSDITYTYFHNLQNVNELLGKISGVAGVKTGFTQNAGEVLVTEVKKNNRSVLFVLLKSEDRFSETAHLIDWVFDNFRWVPIEEILPSQKSSKE